MSLKIKLRRTNAEWQMVTAAPPISAQRISLSIIETRKLEIKLTRLVLPIHDALEQLLESKVLQELARRYTAFCALKAAMRFDQEATVHQDPGPLFKNGSEILALHRQQIGLQLLALHAQWLQHQNLEPMDFVDEMAKACDAVCKEKGVRALSRTWWHRLWMEARHAIKTEPMNDRIVVDLTDELNPVGTTCDELWDEVHHVLWPGLSYSDILAMFLEKV